LLQPLDEANEQLEDKKLDIDKILGSSSEEEKVTIFKLSTNK